METEFKTEFGEAGHYYTVDQERVMLNILEMLRQPVYDLMHEGSTVTLLHYNARGNPDNRENLRKRALTRCPANNFFQTTKQEWEAVRCVFLSGAENPFLLIKD